MALLTKGFIPAAIDCVLYSKPRDDADARVFRRLSDQAYGTLDKPRTGSSIQGHYVLTASGTLLASHNRRGPRALAKLLQRAQAKYRALAEGKDPELAAAIAKEATDPRAVRVLPEGGLTVEVYTRILGWPAGQGASRPEFDRWNADRAGFDHLWILPDELGAIRRAAASGGGLWVDAPRRLAKRIARFHLTDDVRGEPPHFRARDLQRYVLEVRLAPETRGTPSSGVGTAAQLEIEVRGRFRMAGSPQGERWPIRFAGSLEGRLRYDPTSKRWTRFDLLCEGISEGSGQWTPGAPRAPFRLAIGFMLPRSDFAVEIPPQGARGLKGYLRP